MSIDRESQIESTEKTLQEPVFLGHDTNAKIVRAQLLLVSAITLAYMLMGLKISSESSFLGLKFSNLTERHIQIVLLILLVYLAVHFIWLSLDAFMEWRLRSTGAKNTFIAGMTASSDMDYPQDPRQSTLYYYYVQSMSKSLLEIQEKLQQFNERGDEAQLESIKSQLMRLETILNSPRVEVSLRRFNDWFKYFLMSQNLRWISIEFSLPLMLAIWAILMILKSI